MNKVLNQSGQFACQEKKKNFTLSSLHVTTRIFLQFPYFSQQPICLFVSWKVLSLSLGGDSSCEGSKNTATWGEWDVVGQKLMRKGKKKWIHLDIKEKVDPTF